MKLRYRLWLLSASTIAFLLLAYWLFSNPDSWIDDFFIVIAIFTVWVFHVLFERFLLRRIRMLRNFSAALAGGDLAALRPSLAYRDEFSTIFDLIENLRTYMLQAADFVKNIEERNLDAANEVLQKSEDKLSVALISMRIKMREIAREEQERLWATNGLALFDDLFREYSRNLETLSRHLVSKIASYAAVNQVGLFLLDKQEGREVLKLVASYAYDRQKFLTKIVGIKEGLVGQAFLEKSVVYMPNVPENYIHITSGLGKAVPKAILLLPVLLNEEVYGVLEVASLREIPQYKIAFLKKFCENLGYTVSNVKSAEKTQDLLLEAQKQSERLLNQEREMRESVTQLAALQEEKSKKQQVLEALNEKMRLNEKTMKDALKKAAQKEAEAQINLIKLRASEQEMAQNIEKMEDSHRQMWQKQRELDEVNRKLEVNEQKLRKALKLSRQEEIDLQRKNRTISKNIRHAKLVQTAVLPTKTKRKSIFPQSFIIFEQKELVGGDFFWFHQTKNKLKVATLLHTRESGIAGAFFCLAIQNMLVKLVRYEKIVTPHILLQRLDEYIRKKFMLEEKLKKYKGVEFSIFTLEEKPDTNKEYQFRFAGVGTNLALLSQKTVKPLGTKPGTIGSQYHTKTLPSQTEEHTLKPGDIIYQYSDASFVGNDDEQKEKFETLLKKISAEPFGKQKELLKTFVEECLPLKQDLTIFGVQC